MSRKPTKRDLRAMGYALADEIETRALAKTAGGLSRVAAINAVLAEMAGHE